MKTPQEIQAKEKLGTAGEIRGEKPVDIIRKMNPGKFIPTGEEFAKMLREREGASDKEEQLKS